MPGHNPQWQKPGVVPNPLHRPIWGSSHDPRGENHSAYDPGKGGGICVYILYNALLCIDIMYLLDRPI